MKGILLSLALISVVLHAQTQPFPATRTALVMGVWNYTDPTFPELKGIEQDVDHMAAKLKELGFSVTVVKNPTLSQAKKAVDAFGADLKARGGGGAFYFSGHGAEHEGRNFLIPIGTAINSRNDLDDEALVANRVLGRMEESGDQVNLVFLDCCRNEMSKAGGIQSLAPMQARGSLIGFATASGKVAFSTAQGSPYTEALIKYIDTPGVSLSDMHTLVAAEVQERSRKLGTDQRPGQYVELSGLFQMVPSTTGRGGLPAAQRTSPEESLLDAATPGKVIQFKLPGGELMKFCYCPAGSFTMGSPQGEEGRSTDEDQVQVRINKGFWMAQMPCTQGQWEALMGGNPSGFKGKDLPVETVSWEDAQGFLEKLDAAMKLPGEWKTALPTEAQWEYACRAGTTGAYAGPLATMGWYRLNSGFTSHAVGGKAANDWGLYDMHGNVLQWCADWYAATLPGGIDPKGPSTGVHRVFRGGSWDGLAAYCRAAYRFNNDPGIRFGDLGFRPALVPSR